MKKLLIATSIVALASTAAFADKPNSKGAGGQGVKSINQVLKDNGTNLGQEKKAANLTGLGKSVKAANKESNG